MHRRMESLARVFALLGGAVLVLLIIMTSLSIAGRSLNSILHADWVMSIAPVLARSLLDLGIGPINGDFELVEAGMAFSIFAFLPICQIHGAHATVDIFTSTLPPRANRVLRGVTEAIFAAILVLIAWKLTEGTASKFRSGQTSLLLEFPVWWAYALSLVAAWVAAVVGVYVAVQRLREMMSGETILPLEMGADH